MIRRFPVSALQKACELQETGIKKLESMGHSVVLFVCQKFNLSDTWLVMDTQTDIGQMDQKHIIYCARIASCRNTEVKSKIYKLCKKNSEIKK